MWSSIFGKEKFSRAMMLRARLDAIETKASLLPAPEQKAANDLHAAAKAALDDDSFEQAWRDVVAAEALMLETSPDPVVMARARAIAAEASGNLPAADAKAVVDLLPDVKTGIPTAPDWKMSVAEAHSLYHRSIIQLMDARERAGKRITFLVFALAILVAVVFSIAFCKPQALQLTGADSSAAESLASPWLLAVATVLGGVGACLSGLLSLTVLGQFPGQFESFSVTSARPLVGLASGLVAALLANSNLVVFEAAGAVAVIAFAFGFSERLIIGAVQKFEAAQK
jgi:hypothetical protein